MVDKWVIKTKKKMLDIGINQIALSKHLGISQQFLSLAFHCPEKRPKGFEERVGKALEELSCRS